MNINGWRQSQNFEDETAGKHDPLQMLMAGVATPQQMLGVNGAPRNVGTPMFGNDIDAFAQSIRGSAPQFGVQPQAPNFGYALQQLMGAQPDWMK